MHVAMNWSMKSAGSAGSGAGSVTDGCAARALAVQTNELATSTVDATSQRVHRLNLVATMRIVTTAGYTRRGEAAMRVTTKTA